MQKSEYIPALKYHWLTGLFDFVLKLMPEKRLKETVLQRANIREGFKILDFGCGTGTLALLAKKQHPDCQIIGADVDAQVLQMARRKVRESGLEIDLHQLTDTFPFENHSIDRVLSTLVFHHLTPEQKIRWLQEIHRILKPDGQIIIGDFGKPAHWGMRLAVLSIQFLDGFKTTQSSIAGLLPTYLEQVGFSFVRETDCLNSLFGTLRIYCASKSIDFWQN